MKELTTKICNFASAYNLTSNDVLTISFRIASMKMAKDIVERIDKSFDNITEDDILIDYLENIDCEKTESISKI